MFVLNFCIYYSILGEFKSFRFFTLYNCCDLLLPPLKNVIFPSILVTSLLSFFSRLRSSQNFLWFMVLKFISQFEYNKSSKVNKDFFD